MSNTNKHDDNKPVPVWERLVWTATDLAAMLNLSRRTITRMNEDEELPKPVWFKGRNVYRSREILDWLTADAPRRSVWDWQPALLPTLAQAVTIRRAELQGVQQELDAAQQELDELKREVDESRNLMADMRRMMAGVR